MSTLFIYLCYIWISNFKNVIKTVGCKQIKTVGCKQIKTVGWKQICMEILGDLFKLYIKICKEMPLKSK